MDLTKRPVPSSSFASSSSSKRLKRPDTMSMTSTSPQPPEPTAPEAMSSTQMRSTLAPYFYQPSPSPSLSVAETTVSRPSATVTALPSSSAIAASPAELARGPSPTLETPRPVLSSPSQDTSFREAMLPPPIRRQPSRVFSLATTPPILPPTSTSFFNPVTNQYQLPWPFATTRIQDSPLPKDMARRRAIIRLEASMHVRLPRLVTQEGTYEGNAEQAWSKLWGGDRSWKTTAGGEKKEKLTCMEGHGEVRGGWEGLENCRYGVERD